MTRDNLSDELDGLVPMMPESSGWGPKVRTEHRRRRVRISGVVAGAAAVAVVGIGTLFLSAPEPTILATPAETATEAAEAAPTPKPSITACADRVEWEQTVAELPDVTGAFFCVPENPGGTSFVQVAFSSDLTPTSSQRCSTTPFFSACNPAFPPRTRRGWRCALLLGMSVHSSARPKRAGSTGTSRREWD